MLAFFPCEDEIRVLGITVIILEESQAIEIEVV